MKIRYHGNYVGPGWSAGKYQDSVDSDVACVDEFDCTGKRHDSIYARRGDLKAADRYFYRANIGRGLKRSIAAVGVGLQGYFRSSNSQSIVPLKRKLMFTPPNTRPKRYGRSRGRSMASTNSSLRSYSSGNANVRGRSTSSTALAALRNRSRTASSVRFVRRAPAASSTSGGRFSRGKRVKRFGTKGKMINKGVQYTFEYGKIFTTATEFQAIGHCTMPQTKVHDQVWRTLLKRLLVKAGVKLNAYDDSLNLAVGDKIQVFYRVTDGAAASQELFTYAAAQTLEDMTSFFAANARGYYGTITSAPTFDSIYYIPLVFNAFTKPANISLATVMIDFVSKSSLKIQNRSVTSAGDDEVDLANVPLYGKSYDGNGNGSTWIKGSSTANFHANSVSGVIDQVSSALVSNKSPMGEPPHAKEFVSVKNSGKVRIEPGSIKTSVLSSKIAMNFNRFFETTWKMSLPLSSKLRTYGMGKFRFFCLEKMLDPVAAISIVVAVEHQLSFITSLREKETQMMTQVFEKTYG